MKPSGHSEDRSAGSGPPRKRRGRIVLSLLAVLSIVGLAPLASVAYSHVMSEDFDETGLSPLRMQVEESDIDSAVTSLGIRVATERKMDQGFVIRPRFKALWNHEWIGDDRKVSGNFASDPTTGLGPFSVEGAELTDDHAEISVGWEVGYAERANLFFEWDGRFGANNDPDRQARVLAKMVAGVYDILKRHEVVLVYPIPEVGWVVPQWAAKALLFGVDVLPCTSAELYRARNRAVIEAFDQIEHPNLSRVRPGDILCDSFIPGRCAIMRDGVPLYRDDNHLSLAGAGLVVPEVLKALDGMALARAN